MYKTLLFFYCCCFAFFTPAQNLLLNGDFEEYWECPSNVDEIEKCKNTFNPVTKSISTSDYYNNCASPNYHPFKGMGQVGIILAIYPWVNYEPNGYSEYIQIKLSEKLIAGEQYLFSFYAKAENFNNPLTHTTDCINVKFVSDSVVFDKYLWQIMKPDWKNTSGNYFSDKWKEFNGTYTALGNEEWMIIGFIDDTSTFKLYPIDSVSQFINFGYIYIDNFTLESFISFPNIFTPNNDGVNDFWTINTPFPKSINVIEVCIYNRWGKTIFKAGKEFIRWDGNCNGVPCSDGIYFATVIIENNNSIKRYSGNVTLLR